MLRKSSENKQHRHKADLLRLAKLQSISHELVIGTWEPASHGEHQTVLFLALHKKKKKSQGYFNAKWNLGAVSEAPAAPDGQLMPRASCTFMHSWVLVLTGFWQVSVLSTSQVICKVSMAKHCARDPHLLWAQPAALGCRARSFFL